MGVKHYLQWGRKKSPGWHRGERLSNCEERHCECPVSHRQSQINPCARRVSLPLLELLSQGSERCVAVFEAFIDESGTHKGAPVVGVAGWAAQRAFWKRFLSYWDDRYFHAKEPKCAPLKPALYDAIVDSRLEGFVAWMKPEDYREHTTPFFKSAMGNAYAVCTYACALGICRFARDKKMGPVAFVIEDGQPNSEWVREVLEGMKTKRHFGIASVATASKRDFVELCTADFLAHSLTSDPTWFTRLGGSGLVAEDHITPARMKKMSAELAAKHRILRYQKNLLKRQRT
jgi:hypothetical protein